MVVSLIARKNFKLCIYTFHIFFMFTKNISELHILDIIVLGKWEYELYRDFYQHLLQFPVFVNEYFSQRNRIVKQKYSFYLHLAISYQKINVQK